MGFLQKKRRDVPGKPCCMAASPHLVASNTFLMTRTRRNAFLREKNFLPFSKRVKTPVPILRKIFSVEVPCFQVMPSPSELSFTLKQVFENVGRKIDCHWKAAFRFQSSFYCYSEAVYCLNYLILSWLWVFKKPNNTNRTESGTLFYRGFSLSTQIRDCVYTSLHFNPCLHKIE